MERTLHRLVRENVPAGEASITIGEMTFSKALQQALKAYIKHGGPDEQLHVQEVFHVLFAQLKAKQPLYRRRAVALMHYLFMRSANFRAQMVHALDTFTQLAIGTTSTPLPPPLEEAQLLKTYALECLCAWKDQFAVKYPALANAYTLLHSPGHLQVGMANVPLSRAARERQEAEERQRRFRRTKMERNKAKMARQLPLIEESLLTLDNAVALSSRRATETPSAYHRQLREHYTLLQKKHTVEIKDWVNTIERLLADEPEDSAALRVDLAMLQGVLARVETSLASARAAPAFSSVQQASGEVAIRRLLSSLPEEEEEDEDEFLEVQEEVPLSVAAAPRPRRDAANVIELAETEQLFYQMNEEERQKFSQDSLALHRERQSPAKREEQAASPPKAPLRAKRKISEVEQSLLQQAPVIEYNDDLDLWKSSSVALGRGLDVQHRFWGTDDIIKEIDGEHLAQLKKRVTYYKSDEVDEIEPCRAPLTNGGLCPRRDKVKCPFHGIKVPRDDQGRPLSEAEAVRREDTIDRILSMGIPLDEALARLEDEID